MKRVGLLVLLALGAGGCVSGDSASSGAVRVLNAVPDAPRMSMYVDNRLKAANIDYRNGSAWFAFAAGGHAIRIVELLPPDADADPDESAIFDASLNFAVNDEITLVAVGSAAAQTEEILQIPTRTRGVPTGKTRLQVVHTAAAVPAVDVYVIAPDALVSASTPFATGVAYKAWTPQAEVTGGNARIVVTVAGNPTAVLLDSDQMYLTLEGTLLIAVVTNPGLDAAERPVQLAVLTGTGVGAVLDTGTRSSLRLVNASPGAYTLDAFVNQTSVDDSARQACDPPTPGGTTLVVRCALAYQAIGPFDVLEPANYEIKLQKSDAAGVTARSFPVGLAAGLELTALAMGLVSDTATTTEVTLQSYASTRRVATAGQLRLIDVSLAGDAAVAGDPTTDRLEYYITPACVALDAEDPDFTGVRRGSDTGYLFYEAGNYQVTLAKADTATPDAVPTVLLTKRVTLAASGIYTLAITDSVGGVQPLQFLSLDDDPALADCPAP